MTTRTLDKLLREFPELWACNWAWSDIHDQIKIKRLNREFLSKKIKCLFLYQLWYKLSGVNGFEMLKRYELSEDKLWQNILRVEAESSRNVRSIIEVRQHGRFTTYFVHKPSSGKTITDMCQQLN